MDIIRQVSIFLNKINLNQVFEEKNELIQQWYFYSKTVEKINLDQFYQENFGEIGWSSYEIKRTSNKISISFNPMFFVESICDDIQPNEKIILENIKKKITNYVDYHKVEFVNQISIVEPLKDMYAFTLQEVGHSSIPEFDIFINDLKEKNIQFFIEYENSQMIDQGASGGFYEVIIFIQNSLLSGALYDLLKNLPSIKFLNLKRERFDILKDKAAEHINTQPENLEILELEQLTNNHIKVTFYFNRFNYKFQFDDSNLIISFKKEKS